MFVCSRKNTNDEIKIAKNPVLEPERNTAIAITTKPITIKYRSIFFAFKNKYKPIGNPIAKTAAKPAGLSKLPVIENWEDFGENQPKNWNIPEHACRKQTVPIPQSIVLLVKALRFIHFRLMATIAVATNKDTTTK